jgi:lipopolysaccharide/colanic/teichoic acid biosynthesis glycosyltransferase
MEEMPSTNKHFIAAHPAGKLERHFGSTSDLVFQRIERRPIWRIKRCSDILISAAILVLLSPLFLCLFVAVATTSRAPAIVWQLRQGERGRQFRRYKFNTFRTERNGFKNTLPQEQRPTALGRFLIQSRIDRLPQLWNVLRGDMSIIGPRPTLPAIGQSAADTSITIRPGLVSIVYAQGKNATTALEARALNDWYFCNASLRLEIQILCNATLTYLGLPRRDVTLIRAAMRQAFGLAHNSTEK